MPCYHPLSAFLGETKANGKKRIYFGNNAPSNAEPIKLPCGRCIGCRLEYSRQWAMRISHEASLFDDNCFITLTYNDQNLPPGGTLVKKHYQDFMKRLRRRNEPKRIRFYQCGEYGERKRRPHYHAILFNHDFPDKVPFQEKNGFMYYYSEILEKIWGKGFCLIGQVTFESAAYVARYVTKKVNGELKEKIRSDGLKWYETVTDDGEILNLVPEYATMSRGGCTPDDENMGGIGKRWFDQFKGDCYPKDFVTINGKEMRPPRYYDSLYEISEPDCMKLVKDRRKEKALEYSYNNTEARLAVREQCKNAQIKSLKRSYEEDD